LKTTSSPASLWLYVCLVALSAVTVLSIQDIISNTHFGEIDFMGYWSATHLFSKGENPYSLELMMTVQLLEAHSTLDVTIMSWNPPTLFIFLLPFGVMPFVIAKFAWLFINLTMILTGALIIEHIPRANVLDELNRVLQPGGFLILGTPDYGNREWLVTEWLYKVLLPQAYTDEHITHYTYREVVEEFVSNREIYSQRRADTWAKETARSVIRKSQTSLPVFDRGLPPPTVSGFNQ
jgi:hypothetical protein